MHGVDWRRLAQVATVAAAALCLGYLVAVTLGLIPRDRRLGSAELVLAGGILLLGIASSQSSRYAISDLTLGTAGVSARIQKLDERQSRVESNVAALRLAVSGVVNKFEVEHLKRLASRSPAVVRYSTIMISELTRLDAIDYIRPIDPRGLNAIGDDRAHSQDDFDLKQYVDITDHGLQYLRIRESLADAPAQAG